MHWNKPQTLDFTGESCDDTIHGGMRNLHTVLT